MNPIEVINMSINNACAAIRNVNMEASTYDSNHADYDLYKMFLEETDRHISYLVELKEGIENGVI